MYATEILVYEQCKNYTEFNTVFSAIEKIRKEDPFFKHIGKQLALQSLGSFSLDIGKYTKTSPISSYSTLASHLCDTKSTLQNYSFFGNNDSPHCLVEMQTKQELFKSSKINTLIYTTCSNNARIKLYTLVMKMIDMFPQSTSILRLDADAVTLAVLKENQIAVENVFKHHNFKLEHSTSTGVISFKSRSYLTLDSDNESGILKTCGLSLALSDRFESINYNKLAGDYINDRLNKNIYRPRIVDTEFKTTSDYQCLNSIPFGQNN